VRLSLADEIVPYDGVVPPLSQVIAKFYTVGTGNLGIDCRFNTIGTYFKLKFHYQFLPIVIKVTFFSL
jgi:hypothetical protein